MPYIQVSSDEAAVRRRGLVRTLPTVVVLAVLATSHALGAKKDDAREIGPGPTAMSEAEIAIEADPAAGMEHAVILVEETNRDENLGAEMETTYHLRAKILSNEGRDLANVEIPLYRHDSKLKRWWGRTILPDGTVHELAESELDRQAVSEGRTDLKAALPGVVSGCVIDYGYTTREAGLVPYERIPLQRRWSVRDFHLAWTPYQELQGAYHLTKAAGLNVDVQVDKGRGTIVVNARDLPPVVEEPMMPADHEVSAAVIVYYVPLGTDFEGYWNATSKSVDKAVRSVARKKKSVEAAMAAMEVRPGGILEQGLQQVYAWIGRNVKRSGLETFEQLQQAADEGEDSAKDPVGSVLSTRQGSVFDVQMTFLAIARALGADAQVVFAADRTEGPFDPLLKTWGQFDSLLVAVRSPDSTGPYALVDSGSGLAYGEIPWQLSGGQGLMMTSDGTALIPLPPSNAKKNISESKVEISFAEGNEALVSSWVQTGTGQVGLDERRYLRGLSPDRRTERIDELCGLGPETDIVTAEVVALEDVNRNLELHCATESLEPGITEDVAHYQLEWGGPWVPYLPVLPDQPRAHPVVFDFPRIDVVHVSVKAPEGYVPDDPPPRAVVDGPVGRYILEIQRKGDGFSIERAISVMTLSLAKEHYGKLREFVEEARRLDGTPLNFTRADVAGSP